MLLIFCGLVVNLVYYFSVFWINAVTNIWSLILGNLQLKFIFKHDKKKIPARCVARGGLRDQSFHQFINEKLSSIHKKNIPYKNFENHTIEKFLDTSQLTANPQNIIKWFIIVNYQQGVVRKQRQALRGEGLR